MASQDESLKLLRAFLDERDPRLYIEHRDDLRRSGLIDETIRLHRIQSVPKPLVRRLLGWLPQGLESTLLIPYPDPAGGFMLQIRVKVFPALKGPDGHTIKYLQPKGSGARLFFPLMTLQEARQSDRPLFLVEGEKKALAVAQLGLPAVGFCGIEGWHVAGSRDLLPDFDWIRLRGRFVELLPDGDWQTNPNVERGAFGLAEALEARGATVRLIVLPTELPRA